MDDKLENSLAKTQTRFQFRVRHIWQNADSTDGLLPAYNQSTGTFIVNMSVTKISSNKTPYLNCRSTSLLHRDGMHCILIQISYADMIYVPNIHRFTCVRSIDVKLLTESTERLLWHQLYRLLASIKS